MQEHLPRSLPRNNFRGGAGRGSTIFFRGGAGQSWKFSGPGHPGAAISPGAGAGRGGACIPGAWESMTFELFPFSMQFLGFLSLMRCNGNLICTRSCSDCLENPGTFSGFSHHCQRGATDPEYYDQWTILAFHANVKNGIIVAEQIHIRLHDAISPSLMESKLIPASQHLISYPTIFVTEHSTYYLIYSKGDLSIFGRQFCLTKAILSRITFTNCK